MELWSAQQEIAQLLLRPPYRVLVKAGHGVGKTCLAACLVSWWFDTRRSSSAVISTAPTHRDVCDLLWREVRLRRGCRSFRGESAPELWDGPNHFAKGFTAKKGESFQGRHLENMLFVFDEAVGVDPLYWETAKSMFDGHSGKHAWLAIFNPTDSSSQAYQEEFQGGWHVVTMSALDHPNVLAQLRREPPPYPGAVSLGQVNDWLTDWADPIAAEDATGTDLEWPPGSGKWLRPGPLAESRVLGRWPSQAAYAVWSDALWQSLLAVKRKISRDWPVQIGCDVARFGDDSTSIHVRKGFCSLSHESHNGWDTARTAGRLKELCELHADTCNEARRIVVTIDETGLGAGVVDQGGVYNFRGVNCAEVSRQPDRYRDLRSELWFAVREFARGGWLDVNRLNSRTRQELGRQLLAPRYGVDVAGRLQVEAKDETKKRIKRSPDDADAFNLAYFPVAGGKEKVIGNVN